MDSMEQQSPITWDLYWGIVRRRRWFLLLPILAGWLLLFAATFVLPPSFKSQALILVQGQVVPKDYVTPNVASGLQERVQAISQQILSRTRLLRIVEDFRLYRGKGGAATPDEAVDRMRSDISVQLVTLDQLSQDSQGKGTSSTNKNQPNKPPDAVAFRISYNASRPALAQQVASQLASLFIEENLRAREQQSEITTGFLSNQLEQARKDLEQQNTSIREFKARYLGELPGQGELSSQMLSSLERSLQASNDALNRAQQQKLYLDSLVAQYHAMRTGISKESGNTQTPESLKRELQQLYSRLAELNARYMPGHPDVKQLKQQIADDEKEKAKLEQQTAASQQNAAKGSGAPETYAELQSMMPVLQVESQLKSNAKEIADRQAEVKRLQDQVQLYRARMAQVPLREEQLAVLTRDYDQTQAYYNSLLKKKNESELATNLEKRNQGEQFTIINPPNLPDLPDFPNRFIFSLIGIGAGLLVGFLLIVCVELLDDCVRSAEQVKEIVPAMVLAAIPPLFTPAEQRHLYWRRALEWACASVIVIIVVAGTALSYHG